MLKMRKRSEEANKERLLGTEEEQNVGSKTEPLVPGSAASHYNISVAASMELGAPSMKSMVPGAMVAAIGGQYACPRSSTQELRQQLTEGGYLPSGGGGDSSFLQHLGGLQSRVEECDNLFQYQYNEGQHLQWGGLANLPQQLYLSLLGELTTMTGSAPVNGQCDFEGITSREDPLISFQHGYCQ